MKDKAHGWPACSQPGAGGARSGRAEQRAPYPLSAGQTNFNQMVDQSLNGA
jgi:hypothetical protein